MRALIVSGGKRPSKSLLVTRAEEADVVIAADSGMDACLACGILPDIMVGDFDSIKADWKALEHESTVQVVAAPAEKDETDTQLAYSVAAEAGATSIMLLGATGGRIDHLLSNLMFLKRGLALGIDTEIEDDDQWMCAVQGTAIIDGRAGQTISLIPIDEYAIVTASGVYYPLDQLKLTNSKPRGVSNVMTGSEVTIDSQEPVYVILLKSDPAKAAE